MSRVIDAAPFRAPAIPIATKVYDKRYVDSFNSVLRLYFNQIDNTLSALITELVVYYGAFSDTTVQAIAAADTVQTVTFNTTSISSGVAIGSPTSRIVITNAAVYNFQFSIQLGSTAGALRTITVWPRVNGVNVANSASLVSIASSSTSIVPAGSFVISMSAGDYFELVWASSGIDVSLAAQASQASPFVRPAVPSVILTVTQVNQ